MKRNPGINVTVAGGGSGNGAKALVNGTCQVANLSRPLKLEEYQAAVSKGVAPVAHVIALDAIAIVVHPSNPVAELSLDQVKAIYAGEITNWKGVGGPDMAIAAFSRESNSGTLDAFIEMVMKHGGEKTIAGSVSSQGSNGAIHSIVKKNPGAIGFVGLGFIEGVKPLKINGVEPSVQTVKQGTYPVARPLFMFTNGYPPMGSKLFRFMTLYLSEDGHELIKGQGFVPLTDY